MSELKPKGLKTSKVILYGFLGMFLNTFYLMFLSYNRLFYLTDVLQLGTTVAATVNTLSVWGNVVTMILAGGIIEKFTFKMGRFRPWAVIGGLMVGVCFTILFSDLGLSKGAAGVLFVVMFVIQSLGYNVLWVSERSLVGPMSTTGADANNLAMAAQQGSTLGGLIYGVVNPYIMGFVGNSYTITALIYGLFIVGGTCGLFVLARDYDNAASVAVMQNTAKKGGAKGSLIKEMTGPVIPFFFAMILNNMHLGFFMTLLAYFTTYVLQDPVILSISVTAGSAAGLVGAWLSKIICNRMGKKKAFIYFSILTGILYILIAFLGKTSIPFLIIRVAIGCFSVVGGMLIPVFANDIADYNVMKYGKDNRAMIQSISGTTIRFGSALSASVCSFALVAIGYDASVEITPALVSSITNLMAFAPAAVCVVSALIFIFYHIDEQELDAWRAKRAEAIAAEAKKG